MRIDTKDIPRDLKLALRHLPKLFFTTFFPVSLEGRSEYRYLGNWVQTFINPLNLNPGSIGDQVHDDRWFYANGVISDNTTWQISAQDISETIDKKIEPLFNPTAGFLIDIIEAIIVRTFNRLEKTTKMYFSVLKPALETGAKVHVIAFSQGSIVMDTTIKELKKAGVDISKLHVHTFGGAHDEFDHPEIFSEHFTNRYDYVSNIGTLFALKLGKQSGKTYMLDRFGHLFGAHYIQDFRQKKYCGGESLLSKFIKEAT